MNIYGKMIFATLMLCLLQANITFSLNEEDQMYANRLLTAIYTIKTPGRGIGRPRPLTPDIISAKKSLNSEIVTLKDQGKTPLYEAILKKENEKDVDDLLGQGERLTLRELAVLTRYPNMASKIKLLNR